MTPQTCTPCEETCAVGGLCVDADRACTHADATALRNLLEEIASRLHDPLHCAVLELAATCTIDPVSAFERWPAVRERVWREG